MVRRLRSSLGGFAPTEILVGSAAVLTLAGWIVLYRWYSLSDHVAAPDFAFDKIPGHFDSPVLRYTTLIFVLMSLLYQAGYWVLRRAKTISGTTKAAIVSLVIGAAAVNTFLYPVGAIDLLDYATQLKLKFHYGLNPYVSSYHVIQPDGRVVVSPDPFAKYSFYPDLPHLLYGPVWLVLSGVASLPVGFTSMLRLAIALKLLNVVLLAATAWALYAYQDDHNRGWRSAYLFIANPWVLFEAVGNGHNDAMLALFLILGVLALKRRSLLAIAFLMLSALVKVFTLVLFPLFLLEMFLRGWGRRRITASVLIGVVMLLAFAQPFWAGGEMARGMSLAMTLHMTMMSSWSVFSLVQQYLGESGVSASWFPLVYDLCVVIFALFAIFVLWGVLSGMKLQGALVTTYLLFTALATHLFSWYLLPVVALLALEQDRVGITLLFTISTTYFVLYPVSVWAWFNSGLRFFGIHLFQALFLLLPIVVFLGLDLTRTGLAIAQRRRTRLS